MPPPCIACLSPTTAIQDETEPASLTPVPEPSSMIAPTFIGEEVGKFCQLHDLTPIHPECDALHS